MINSDNVLTVYYATKLYFTMAKRDTTDNFYPLHDLYKKYKEPLENKLMNMKANMSNSFLFSGKNKEQGLWDVILIYNNQVSKDGRLQGLE